MIDREKVIKGLEETEIRLKQAVDRGGEMSVMGAFKCLNNVTDAIALLKEQETIVRCMDCKYGWLLPKSPFVGCQKPYGGSLRHSIDYYCADGERKDDDD